MMLQCETCNGTGFALGGQCETCNGAGIARIDEREVLYFGTTIDRGTIVAEKVSTAVRAVGTLIVALFGVVGIGAIIAEIFPHVGQLFERGYWYAGSPQKVLFAISLFTDLYLIMRVLRKNAEYKPVKPFPETLIHAAPRSWSAFIELDRAHRIDIASGFSSDVKARIREAYMLALRFKHAEMLPVHLFVALLESAAVRSLIIRLEIDGKGLHERLKHLLNSDFSKIHNASQEPSPGLRPPSPRGRGEGEGRRGGEPVLGQPVKEILLNAYVAAQRAAEHFVGAHHVLFETVMADPRIKEIFFDLSIDEQKLINAVRWLDINEEIRRRWQRFRGAAGRRPKGEMNRAMTALQTKMLDRYSDDLTLFAGRGYLELIVDREKEFEEIFRILEGERKSVILVGPHGVGKESIVQGIAQRMIEEQVPKMLQDRRLVTLSVPKLVAGVSVSVAQERLLHCLSDIGQARNVILAIPNIHEMVGSSDSGLDMSQVLAGELGKGYFLTIATTTPEDYRERIEGTALGHAFAKIDIGEPNANVSIHILESKVGAIEHQRQVYFSYNALEKAVTLSHQYIKDQVLPETAIEVAKEVAEYVHTHRGSKSLVRAEDVAEIISTKSHVPVTSVTANEAEKLLNLENVMHERIIGQDEAVRAVSSALRRARAELREQKRPIANFLFLGPTGVGKTETAKTVAEAYFGSEDHMVRIDMSEYQDTAGIARLLGAPGQKGGLLTEPVRKNPFTLILLDEIEKAHPDILNIFLQVMDDGRVTDSVGRVVDFTNSIIIATSNAGTTFVQQELQKGTPMEVIKKILIERELKQFFKPEFLNRFDGVIVYKPLTEPEIVQIAKLILAKIGKQLEVKGIAFRATDEATAELAHAGFDPQFGARPLRRVIQERVQDALANLLLTSKISRRDIVVLEKDGVLRVDKAEKL